MQMFSLVKGFISDATLAVEFVERRCLRRRLNCCECNYCLDACPAQALSLENRQIQLDTRKCTSCMQCTAVCPNDAFSSPEYDFMNLIESTPGKDSSVFSCTRQTQIHPEEKVVPCMGIFSIELLLVIGLTGPAVTAFNISKCSECENKAVIGPFTNALKHLKKYCSALLSTRFSLLTNPDQINSLEEKGRRSFLSDLTNNIISFAGSQILQTQDMAMGTLTQNRRIPKKVQLIKKLIESAENDQKEMIKSFCAYQLTASNNCTLCPLCTGICPTGALKVGRLDGEKQLLFRNTLCSGCGLCVSFCKQKAIKLSFPMSHKILNDQAVDKAYLTANSA